MEKLKVLSKTLSIMINNPTNSNGGKFTIQSIKTGKDYTFKIKRTNWKNNMYTHVYVEVEYMKFKHLGFYSKGNIIKGSEKVETPSVIGIAYILNLVEQEKFETLDNQIDIFHIGKCMVCGKPLTDAESIKSGIGPVCRNR